MTTNNENTEFTGTATYCPEDDKLRLYVGRVPRDEYLKLRAEGWISTPKQTCDFVAVWTVQRRNTALSYAGVIDDEDAGPAERAADRAERFAGYRDKRTADAVGKADAFDAVPVAHGFQSAAKAERAAARHDRLADRAGDFWSKAEYWQRRTAGVISHALYKSTPAVRMGRIKVLEAELRKVEKGRAESASEYQTWQKIAAMTDADMQTKLAERFAGVGYGFQDYKHPVNGRVGSLWCFVREDAADRLTGSQIAAMFLERHIDPASDDWKSTPRAEWINHLNLRLSYENQMCEAAGGRAALVEMVCGGFVGNYQIQKINKSPVTALVVSVEVMARPRSMRGQGELVPVLYNVERLGAEAYRPPTEDELTAFQAARKAAKDARPKVIKPPLINPTEADAVRLQAIWNERAKADYCARMKRAYGKDYAEEFKLSTVCRITQAVYSQNSKGSYARTETRGIRANAEKALAASNMYSRRDEEHEKLTGPDLCFCRITSSDGHDYGAKRVIILTDKPQKPLPDAVWEAFAPGVQSETVAA